MAVTPIPERIFWTVELLEVRPSDHLLEIGCGPGHAVALVAEKLKRGAITAIDRSALQITKARHSNSRWTASGLVTLEQGTLEEFDPGHRFDRIFAINVNAFWTAPAPSIASLKRLLKPAGTAYLVYDPPTEAKLVELREQLPKLLREQGFRTEDVCTRAFRKGHGLCVRGRPG